ncbi:MAG: hypothetical protein KFF50_10710 [Desulfatitalea sp.]|nr:hypothetical protein [Desulfatitalea sp.]
MSFVIAGVQPKTRTLDNAPRRCPRCGLHQAYTQRVDLDSDEAGITDQPQH